MPQEWHCCWWQLGNPRSCRGGTPAGDRRALILTWLGTVAVSHRQSSWSTGRASAVACLCTREVTLRDSSIRLAPNIQQGCPRDECDSGPSSQQQEISLTCASALGRGDAVVGRYRRERFHVGSARRGEGRGSAPGQRAEHSHYQAGLCWQEAAFDSQEAELGWYRPWCEGQGSVLSAVEHSRWGSSRHSLPSHSCPSSPSLMALQHNPLGEGMLPCRAVKLPGPQENCQSHWGRQILPCQAVQGHSQALHAAEPRTGSFQFFWQCLSQSA